MYIYIYVYIYVYIWNRCNALLGVGNKEAAIRMVNYEKFFETNEIHYMYIYTNIIHINLIQYIHITCIYTYTYIYTYTCIYTYTYTKLSGEIIIYIHYTYHINIYKYTFIHSLIYMRCIHSFIYISYMLTLTLNP